MSSVFVGAYFAWTEMPGGRNNHLFFPGNTPICNVFVYCAADATVGCPGGQNPGGQNPGSCQLKFQSGLDPANPVVLSNLTNLASGEYYWTNGWGPLRAIRPAYFISRHLMDLHVVDGLLDAFMTVLDAGVYIAPPPAPPPQPQSHTGM
jgi:hypothetical protein